MSKFEHKKVMPRYSAIAIIMTLIATAIVGKALYIMTAKHDYWMQVAERQKRDSVTVKPNRGNILSCAGQLMASSLPEFKVFMDFKALTAAGNDSLWDAKQDSICQGLHKIFPEKSAEEFKRHLIQQLRVYLMVEEHIDFYNVRANDLALLGNSLLQKLHPR